MNKSCFAVQPRCFSSTGCIDSPSLSTTHSHLWHSNQHHPVHVWREWRQAVSPRFSFTEAWVKTCALWSSDRLHYDTSDAKMLGVINAVLQVCACVILHAVHVLVCVCVRMWVCECVCVCVWIKSVTFWMDRYNYYCRGDVEKFEGTLLRWG